MKFMDEYRDRADIDRIANELRRRCTRNWTLMEVCGGQTHTIVKYGLDTLLPPGVALVHGPGCPVCVTPVEMIDRALAIASRPGVTFCSFGDMLRVPGSRADLFQARARGADVRFVYSPLDCVKLAQEHPEREVVFFAVGFETTAPANALAIQQAAAAGLQNFSMLVAHVLVPPALEAILQGAHCRVQGFLAAGHVCAVMGYEAYHPIAARYRVPIVVTGFEPLDILQGVLMAVTQLETGRAEVENQYSRSVQEAGNRVAQAMLCEVFEAVPRKWRGLGSIPQSGLALRPEYALFDAERRFHVATLHAEESPLCISGAVLQGHKRPHECPAFGTACTPLHPLGAPMVSSEGACAAYHRYRPQDLPAASATGDSQ
ncbi:MAG: hydrogenase formation protein HypD [Candidatus Hydrogenedentes bacterium]|nr:hydrogenase formation protein HypD [Candidatus Hydrogenedentota bacterium]